MSFIMLMLGMYPDHQQRVYEELQPLLVDGRDVSQAELGELKFLDMFIKETLRVFPVVPFLTRTTTADIQIGAFSSAIHSKMNNELPLHFVMRC